MNINEFQKMMHQLYFERDSERGIEGTLDWLKDEVEELKEALEEGGRRNRPPRWFPQNSQRPTANLRSALVPDRCW